jgi:tetratricopeptide (TPR) repeat protein
MAIDRAKIQKQAETFMASGKVDRAIDEFRKLLEDKPDDFNLMNRIGDACLQIGKLPDALDMFKRAGQGYERSGFTNKAAAVFKKAHRAAPEDVDVAARLAETYRATNMIKDAIQIHIEVADYFTKKGLLKRALEEFAKVVELDPKNLKNKVKLADLYNKEGMKERAAEIYLEVAEALAFEQMPAEAIQVLDRAKAMTTSPKVFLTQSRLSIVQKDLAAASQHLREGLAANPRNTEILEALAEVEIQAKAPERALEVLGQIPQLPEKATVLCERALREMVRTNTTDEGLRLFKPIGREFARRGMGEQASRTIRSAFQGVALPVEAWLQLADIAHQSGDRQGRIEALSQAHGLAVASNDTALIRNLEEQLQSLGVAASEIEAQPQPELPPAFQGIQGSPRQSLPSYESTEIDPIKRMQIQQLQREAESYIRSRFNDRALDAFQKVLELDPTNADAINRIADIHKASGVMTKVQQHYVRTAEKLAPMGHRQLAVEMLDKAEELFPGSTRLHRRMLGLVDLAPAPPPPAPTSVSPIPLASGPAAPPPQTSDLDVLIALDDSGAGQQPPPPPPLAPRVPAIALGVPGESYEPEVLSPNDLVWAPPEEEILPVEAELPPEPSVVDELQAEDELIPELEPLELEPLPFAQGKVPVAPPSMPAPKPTPPLAAGPVAAPAEITEELASTLSDIDFQLDYGSPDEAKIEIENALKEWPGHPELLDRLERAQEALRKLGHTAAAPASLADDAEFAHSFFDLTDVLGDALLEPGEGEEMHDATNVVEKIHSVDELFNAFREGVEQQVKVDDYETHYNLGIAYKEMMLIDPALEEFKKAMRDPERTLECCSMLAICEQVQGNLEAAVDWLHQGIDAPGFPPEDSIGLRYDLGEILELLGRSDEARQHFQTVYDMDSEYRDVAKKLP